MRLPRRVRLRFLKACKSIQKSKVQPSASVKDFGFKDLSGVLARGNDIKAFFQGLSAIAFSLGLGPLALKKLLMDLLKGSPLFS